MPDGSPPHAAVSALDSPKRRILLAEDVRVIALSMRRALEHAGYSVDVATDGEECLRKALEAAPDLVVLDIMMPKMHGIEVLRRLREDARSREMAVLICTAKDFKTEQDEATRLGATGFLIKPRDPQVLVDKVNAILGQGGDATAASSALAAGEAEIYNPQLDPARARFTLWGTRGSTPITGGHSGRHGGNTSCMSVTAGEEVFVFDAGSGIRDLGSELMAGQIRRLHLFVTHTHWDHIQGFPFFAPAYALGFEITVFGAKGFGKDLESIFRGQLDRDYFPVQLEDMKSNLSFRHLPAEPPLRLGQAAISWEFAQHPSATVGYKLQLNGRTIAWLPDNEFLQGYTGRPAVLPREHPLIAPHEKMVEFLTGVDVVIHEAQYTPEEYPKKIGWGHSSIANAALLMKLAGMRRWIVTHHDPAHDDAFLEMKLNLTRQILEEIGHPMQVTHGYDGLTEYL